VRDYRLVEWDSEPGTEEISVRTPLGSALLGRHVGDVVSFEKDDQRVRLEVVEIDG
jgi:transcription elongation GreA/GreB family factor